MPDTLQTLLLMAASTALGKFASRRRKMRRRPVSGGAGSVTGGTPPAFDTKPSMREEAALALLDIDDLRGVNIARDYDTGDRLLNAIGDILHRALPLSAELERLDRGRFLIRFPDMPLPLAFQLVERLRGLASQTLVEGARGPVSRALSAGVVVAFEGESRTRAILRADAALARAKSFGGDCTEAACGLPLPALTPPRADLEAAVATRALEYHVQPIFDLRTRRAAGVEALLRWNRPDGVIVGPAGFMDTLDRIPEAGATLFPDLAVRAATPFVMTPEPIYATFNITGAVLDGENSPEDSWLSEVLERLPPENLVLEIVETAVIVRPERAADMIAKLRARGIRIALDDFGTGLSNLERLRRFPVDILKVDRAFVDGLGGAGREEAILASVVALSDGLDIDMIAEGVETEAQAETLRKLGVHFGQGYHLGRPAPATEWAARMARGFTA